MDDVAVGESGRAWEGAVLGGTVEAFESTSNLLRGRQAGILYLLDSQRLARRLDQSGVRRILEFSKSRAPQTISLY